MSIHIDTDRATIKFGNRRVLFVETDGSGNIVVETIIHYASVNQTERTTAVLSPIDAESMAAVLLHYAMRAKAEKDA